MEVFGGWRAQVIRRAPVATVLVVAFFVGTAVMLVLPSVVFMFALRPELMVRPWQWHRFLTYALFQGSIMDWALVSAVALISGSIAEPWLRRRDAWMLALLAALSSGIVYALLADTQQPAIGGGFVVSGFAGASAVICGYRWRSLTELTKVTAGALTILYVLSILEPTPASVAMFISFVVGGAFVRKRILTSIAEQPADTAVVV